MHELHDVQTYPCLTITLPTHRTRPDNKQDPIRVKNLVTEGTNRLLGEFSKREVGPLLDRLNALVDRLDYECTLDGLVLAVNRDMAREIVIELRVRFWFLVLCSRVPVIGLWFTVLAWNEAKNQELEREREKQNQNAKRKTENRKPKTDGF